MTKYTTNVKKQTSIEAAISAFSVLSKMEMLKQQMRCFLTWHKINEFFLNPLKLAETSTLLLSGFDDLSNCPNQIIVFPGCTCTRPVSKRHDGQGLMHFRLSPTGWGALAINLKTHTGTRHCRFSDVKITLPCIWLCSPGPICSTSITLAMTPTPRPSVAGTADTFASYVNESTASRTNEYCTR